MARFVRRPLFALVILTIAMMFTDCRKQHTAFVVALETNPETLDALRGTDASSERLRQLMFNTLVRKDERYEYVGDLADAITPAADQLSYTFVLRDDVTFHDRRPFTSADAKYTLDTLLASDSRKAASFFEGAGPNRRPFIAGVDAPDAKTLVVRLTKPWTQLLNNLVAIPMLPQGSAGTQKDHPLGTGPFSFVRYDEPQQYVDLTAYENYWQGAPQIKNLRVRVILDPNTLQAELKSNRIDLVPPFGTLSPDAYQSLANDSNFVVQKFPGANIVYLQYNTERAPLDDARVRRAISYAINRESIVRELLLGQAEIAHSILPTGSWAYAAGEQYAYDPEKAKKILDEAGLRPDAGGMRFNRPIVFVISSGNIATRQFAGVMQNSLKEVGIPAQIDTLELNSLLEQLRNGQYQMTSSRWVGGNQDPIFLRDLFASSQVPTEVDRAGRNRSRYRNMEVDKLLDEATNTFDREKARALYTRVQEIVSRDVPMFPLWYPSQMVIARRNVGNIKIDGSGDWSFIRQLTIQ